MPEQMAGFPYWTLTFDAAGDVLGDSSATLVRELKDAALTDLIVFSHGWNNSAARAQELYKSFFEQLQKVMTQRAGLIPAGVKVGTVGVIWPSMRWPDEAAPARAGGAASLADPTSDEALVKDLLDVYDAPEQQQAIGEMAALLKDRPRDMQELARFQHLMKTLAVQPDPAGAVEDNGEIALLTDQPEVVFRRLAAAAPSPRRQGGAGVGDVFRQLWNGAKEALRQTTYWEMKNRAGVVGQRGLGPVITRVHGEQPTLRVHLVGHSFGARLVSFALSGLPAEFAAQRSPVKSLMLLQGAFSHFAFAEKLPFDGDRGGALAGMSSRVDGPLMVSHSLLDTAVGKLYPLASIAGRSDAAGLDEALYRWGAMGHDGAQAVPADKFRLGPVGQDYPFEAGRFVNLDGNKIITKGGPPSGAHSDIVHPEIAWALMAGARLAKVA
jgi:hypothetical protein